jgi:hypothetical protein
MAYANQPGDAAVAGSRRHRLTGATSLNEHERSQPYLYDLDPPKGRWQRVLGAILWLTVALLVAIPLRLFLIDDGTASQLASEPSTRGLAELCSQFALPTVLREFADLAYPIWNNVCDLVGR